MATYTDKLFKLRNGRWEDLLSDEVNRDVASRFAGRSVACVDRTVSGQRWGSPSLRPRPTPLGMGVPPAAAWWLSGLAAPPAIRAPGIRPHGCRWLINAPVEVIYVPVTCSFFFLLPQQFVSQ